MGCDIHCFAEKRNNGKWEKVGDVFTLDEYEASYYKKEKSDHPFSWRSYSMFAFLACVRNYDHCNPISTPRGLPSDISPEVKEEYNSWDTDAHSSSWLSAKELLNFDYDKTFENRRTTVQIAPNVFNGAGLAEKGQGQMISYRDNLGVFFFKHLEELKNVGNSEDVRIVFWFDN